LGAVGWGPDMEIFGKSQIPNIDIRTHWKTGKIWLRSSVDVPRLSRNHVVMLKVWNDDIVEVFVNGQLLIKHGYHGNDHDKIPLSDDQRALFRKGKNTLAVLCHNTAGPGQGVDVGLQLILNE
jgi:hypothetical protein